MLTNEKTGASSVFSHIFIWNTKYGKGRDDMNIRKQYGASRLAALLSAVLLAASLTACEGGSSARSDASGAGSSGNSSSAAQQSDASTQNDSSKGEHASDSLNQDESTKPDPDTSESSGNGSENSVPDPDSSSNPAPESSQGSQGGQSGNSTTESSQPTPPEESSDDASENPEVKQPKYIYLKGSTAQYSGTGITVLGSTITISKGGTYIISGTLDDGQIQVLTDDKKVYLELDNAHITNSKGSALNVQQVKHITVTTLAGTTNSFTDGGVHEEDRGAIFTNDTIRFEGSGTLNIQANYAHGVRSDDDIILNSGTLNITSAKSGLHCNDGIEINGGKLFCDAGTNGIKTEGYITISGGTSMLIGGVREEKGAIYCDGVFSFTGGTFYAIGNTCSMPNANTTTANVVGMNFVANRKAGALCHLTADGKPVFTMTSPRDYRFVVYGGAGLTASGQYAVSTGGSSSGGNTNNYVTVGGSYSGGTAPQSFASTGKITFYIVG